MRLATQTFGQGPDLVLVHGWGMNAGVWAPLQEKLGAFWHVTAIELPGHGESEFDAQQVDLTTWCDALLDAAPPRALWLGWSLGGQLSLAAAARSPARFSGLALTATNPCFVRSDAWPSGMPAETFQAFAEQLNADAPRTLDRFLALQVRGADGANDTLRRLRSATRARPAPQPGALRAGLALLLANDLRDVAKRLDIPSLWLFGGRDALVPSSASGALQRLAPTAQVRRIDAAGHAPFLSHPDTCLDLLSHFAEACGD